ncbi:MAG: HEAT repeat domain-containing protein, partial [Aigarchaeota archaeon]|nr:HEAT repeat domain-containing protein [Aigarchaeota archaeon]
MRTGIFDLFKPNVEKLKSERDVDGLIKALKHKHIFVRSRAVEALGKIGGARAVEPLIQTLNDEAWHVRGAAAAALGEMGDKRAVEPLVQALKDEGELSWHVRERAARALGKIGEPAEEPLIRALKNESRDVRLTTAWALGYIGDEEAVKSLV